MSPNSIINNSSPIDINNLKNSFFVLHREGKSGPYKLRVINKTEWVHRSQDNGYIDNLGKIIKIVNEAKIENVTSVEKMAIKNRLNEASQKHNLQYRKIQWLKFLFIPWILAQVFHWTIFDKFDVVKNIREADKIEHKDKLEKDKTDQNVPQPGSRQEVEPMMEFKAYLQQVKDGVISNRENLDKTLENP